MPTRRTPRGGRAHGDAPNTYEVRLATLQWCLDNAPAACRGIKQRDRIKIVAGTGSNNLVADAMRSIFDDCDWLAEKDEWGKVQTPKEILTKMWNDRIELWGNSTLQHQELLERLEDIGWVATFDEDGYNPWSGRVLAGMHSREQASLRQTDAAEVIDDLVQADHTGAW